jgi:hypothetical protein
MYTSFNGSAHCPQDPSLPHFSLVAVLLTNKAQEQQACMLLH